jgi:hypothetical protein
LHNNVKSMCSSHKLNFSTVTLISTLIGAILVTCILAAPPSEAQFMTSTTNESFVDFSDPIMGVKFVYPNIWKLTNPPELFVLFQIICFAAEGPISKYDKLGKGRT